MDYMETRVVKRGTQIIVGGREFFLEEDCKMTSYKGNWMVALSGAGKEETPKLKAV